MALSIKRTVGGVPVKDLIGRWGDPEYDPPVVTAYTAPDGVLFHDRDVCVAYVVAKKRLTKARRVEPKEWSNVKYSKDRNVAEYLAARPKIEAAAAIAGLEVEFVENINGHNVEVYHCGEKVLTWYPSTCSCRPFGRARLKPAYAMDQDVETFPEMLKTLRSYLASPVDDQA